MAGVLASVAPSLSPELRMRTVVVPLALALAVALSACRQADAPEAPAAEPAAEPAAGTADSTGSERRPSADRLDAVLAGDWRDPANTARDVWRHPRETLEFFGVGPSQAILEITPGGGMRRSMTRRARSATCAARSTACSAKRSPPRWRAPVTPGPPPRANWGWTAPTCSGWRNGSACADAPPLTRASKETNIPCVQHARRRRDDPRGVSCDGDGPDIRS